MSNRGKFEIGPLGTGSALRRAIGVELLEECSESLVDLVPIAGRHELDTREDLLARLERELQRARARCPYLGYVSRLVLRAFGSLAMGVSDPAGDLDISLEGRVNRNLSPSGHLTDADKSFRCRLLKEVHGVLADAGHFGGGEIELVTKAKVPISRFVESRTAIQCDLSIGNGAGVFKSNVLGELLWIDARVAQLVMLVKRWAKRNCINNARRGTFNSYTLTLLVVAFAQAPGSEIIAPLRTIIPRLREAISSSKSLLSRIPHFTDRIRAWGETHAVPHNRATLLELLHNFFAWFAAMASMQLAQHTESDRQRGQRVGLRRTICPWEGAVVLSEWDRRGVHSCFFVKDPFEERDNCGRTVWPEALEHIRDLALHAREQISCFAAVPAWELSCRWQELWVAVFGRDSAPAPGAQYTYPDTFEYSSQYSPPCQYIVLEWPSPFTAIVPWDCGGEVFTLAPPQASAPVEETIRCSEPGFDELSNSADSDDGRN